MKKIVSTGLALCLCFAPLTVSAASYQEGEFIEELIFMDVDKIVSASKYEQDIDLAPVAINVLTAADIQRSGAKNIADLLKRLPGVWTWVKGRTDMDIGTNGLLEDDSPRLLYLLDGQPMATPMFDGMQWPQVPFSLEEVERIEITRNGGSALYGANAFTGVLNIITKSAIDRKNVIRTYTGDHGVQLYSLTAAHTIGGKLGISATAGWRQTGQTKGWSKSRNEEEVDSYSTPIGNLKVDYKGEGQDLSFFGGYSHGDGGYAASPGDLDIDHVENWENRLVQAKYVNSKIDKTDINVSASMLRLHQHNYKPYSNNVEKYNVVGLRYNLEANVTTKLIPKNTLIVGGTHHHWYAYSKGATTNLNFGREHSQTMNSAFIQDEFNIIEPLYLIASARYDAFNDLSDEVNGRGTIMYELNDKNIIRASMGRSYRKSDIYNRFYIVIIGPPGAGGYFKGNPKLTSQHALHKEVEYRTRMIPNHSLKVSYTQSKYESIYFSSKALIPFGAGFLPQIDKKTTDHIYKIHSYILELEGTPIKDVLKWYGNASFFDAEDDTISRKMADVPEYMVNVGFQWFPVKKAYLSMDYHFQDDFFTTGAGTDPVTGLKGSGVERFHVVDAKIGYNVCKNAEIGVSVENLFNEKHYEFPLHSKRSRIVFVETRISF